MAIDTLPRSGVATMLGGPAPASDGSGPEAIDVFKAQGFVAVRALAERDGLRFVEAVKKNS